MSNFSFYGGPNVNGCNSNPFRKRFRLESKRVTTPWRLPVHNFQHHFLNPRLSALILETYEWISQLSKIQAVL